MFFWNGAKFIIALVKPRLISSNRSSMELAHQHHGDRSSSVYSSAYRCIWSGGFTLLECTRSFSRTVTAREKLSAKGVTVPWRCTESPSSFHFWQVFRDSWLRLQILRLYTRTAHFFPTHNIMLKWSWGSTDLSLHCTSDAVSGPKGFTPHSQKLLVWLQEAYLEP